MSTEREEPESRPTHLISCPVCGRDCSEPPMLYSLRIWPDHTWSCMACEMERTGTPRELARMDEEWFLRCAMAIFESVDHIWDRIGGEL